uniref:THAP-type domain-containing protein n=1 Tax=Heliothis virescens TaxID=7102 RepID=A0A2A4JST2_HELVI
MSEPPVVKRCCVTSCPNTSVTPNVRLFEFPHSPSRSYHRNKWIQAIRRRNNAKWWSPDANSVVCSHHFVSGKPSQDAKNKDYAPSVFYNKSGRKETDSEVRSVSVKEFALEYVSLPALLAPPSARNLASEARSKAYAKLARRLLITERMARVWETRFLDYYAKQLQARAQGRATPRWLSAVDARLRRPGAASDTATATAALDGAVADDDGGAIADDGAASDDGGALSADSGATCDDDGATTTDAGCSGVTAASATTSAGSDADTDDCALSWRRVWAGGLVEALCAAVQARGALCSTTLYTLVRRDRRLRIPLSDLHELW